MITQKRRPSIDGLDFNAAWPRDQYRLIKPAQQRALELIAEHDGRVTLELPTGTGKTAVGYTFLKALADAGEGPLFYLAPTKTLVEQVKTLHPDVAAVYGRNEHECLYFPDKHFRADEIPCLMLANCSHRVNQETGQTLVPRVSRCPYYDQMFTARQSKIVVCTTAFYLFGVFFSQRWDEPAGLVIDEVHNLAKNVRNLLSFDITDHRLARAVELLARMDDRAAKQLDDFRSVLVGIVRRKMTGNPEMLKDDEIIRLIGALEKIEHDRLMEIYRRAVQEEDLGSDGEDIATLKQVETIIYDLHRYIRALQFALPGEDGRQPLNYTVAYYTKELGEHQKVQHRLTVKSYYVAPLIAKMLASRTVVYSATIGNPTNFSWETGIKAPFKSLGSEFPTKNTRIFMPTNTPDLSFNKRRQNRQEPAKVMRKIAQAVKQFARKGHRSLVLVSAEWERQKFLALCSEERVQAISYDAKRSARQVVSAFRDEEEGECLVGTLAQFGEGVDLPSGTAPVIFVLKPAYPPPNDPGRQFEERRFGKARHWALVHWRQMNAALQARGRNIRSKQDVGVTFFISRQFDNFLFASLPSWLEDSYVGTKTFEECVKEAAEILE